MCSFIKVVVSCHNYSCGKAASKRLSSDSLKLSSNVHLKFIHGQLIPICPYAKIILSFKQPYHLSDSVLVLKASPLLYEVPHSSDEPSTLLCTIFISSSSFSVTGDLNCDYHSRKRIGLHLCNCSHQAYSLQFGSTERRHVRKILLLARLVCVEKTIPSIFLQFFQLHLDERQA